MHVTNLRLIYYNILIKILFITEKNSFVNMNYEININIDYQY